MSVAIFCGVLMLGMLIFLFAAPRLRKAKLAMMPKQEFAMRSLASHTVAPKQKLELIDVGGQQILIGVTPGNINYLTTINPKAASAPVAQPSLQPRQVASARQIAAPAKTVAQPETRPGAKAQGRIPAAYAKPKSKENEAISDVTKLIREKLKNIPSV